MWNFVWYIYQVEAVILVEVISFVFGYVEGMLNKLSTTLVISINMLITLGVIIMSGGFIEYFHTIQIASMNNDIMTATFVAIALALYGFYKGNGNRIGAY